MEAKEKLRLDVALPDVTPFEDHDDYDDDFEEEEEDLDLGSPQSLSNYTLDDTWSDEDKTSVSTQQTSSTRLQSQSMISLHKDSTYYPYHLAFGRTKVMEIDRENKRLGKALRKNYEPRKPVLHQPSKVRPTSSVNRRREQERIARENEVSSLSLHKVKSKFLSFLGIVEAIAVCKE